MKAQREAVAVLWPPAWRNRTRQGRWRFPLVVTMTRISPPSATGWMPLDDDNLASALKAVRDEVAAQLGVDDGRAAPVRWVPAQEEGPWGVRIHIEEAAPR